jgi:DNA-binding MarR family transcriptional regulator
MPDDEIVIPALLRAARGTYGRVIGARLVACGCEDMPRNGAFVLGGMANRGASAGAMLGGLGVTRTAGYQLLDVLVARGYLERVAAPDDPMCIETRLTGRGHAAGLAIADAIAEVDEELTKRITAPELAGLRAGLGALAALAADRGEPG